MPCVLKCSVQVSQLCGERFPQCKYLRGRVSWQSGAKEYHKVKLHNKPHTRHLLEKTQDGGLLCSDKKEQRNEQENGFIKVLGLGWRFSACLRISGILWPDIGASSKIGGIL